MKALHFYQHGNTENLHFGEVDTPTAGPDEVVVRVKASALNHLDLWVLKGWPGLSLPMPHVGGADIAGEIHSVGFDVKDWKVGTPVIVNPGYTTGSDEFTQRGEDSLSPSYRIFGEGRCGGFAEFVSVPARNLLEIPDEFLKKHGANAFTEAAAPLLVGLTSWRMLQHRAKLKPGETVLVVGAGGGVNSFSIQLAKAFGANVIALTSSAEKMKKAAELGATEVIDYKSHKDWSREVRRITKGRGVDVVVDNVGAATFTQSINAACRGGRIVTVGNTSGPNVEFDNRLVFTKQISILGSTMGSAKDFTDVMNFIWSHNIRASIDSVFPLKDGKKAYQLMEKGKQFGKILVQP